MNSLMEWLKRRFCCTIDLCDEDGNVFRRKILHCDYNHRLIFDKDMRLIKSESELKKGRKRWLK